MRSGMPRTHERLHPNDGDDGVVETTLWVDGDVRFVVSPKHAEGSLADLLDGLHKSHYPLRGDKPKTYRDGLAIASALAKLHSCNRVHGRLRLSTIIVSLEWDIMLGHTWDVVEWVCIGEEASETEKRRFLRETHVENVACLAPEIIEADGCITPTTASDAYALGCILAHLFLGRSIFASFDGTDEMLFSWRKKYPDYGFPRFLRDGTFQTAFNYIDGELALLRSLLSNHPELRPTPQAVCVALQDLLDGHGIATEAGEATCLKT